MDVTLAAAARGCTKATISTGSYTETTAGGRTYGCNADDGGWAYGRTDWMSNLSTSFMYEGMLVSRAYVPKFAHVWPMMMAQTGPELKNFPHGILFCYEHATCHSISTYISTCVHNLNYLKIIYQYISTCHKKS